MSKSKKGRHVHQLFADEMTRERHLCLLFADETTREKSLVSERIGEGTSSFHWAVSSSCSDTKLKVKKKGEMDGLT